MNVSATYSSIFAPALLALGGCATPAEYRFENQRAAYQMPGLEHNDAGPYAELGGVLYDDTQDINRDAVTSDIQQLNNRLRNGDFASPDPSATGTQIGGSTPPPRSIIPTSDRP